MCPFLKKKYKELLFQSVLIIMLFLFYSFTYTYQKGYIFENHRAAFFVNYLFSALIIGYVLLPKLYYKQKYWQFLAMVLVMLSGTLLIEEFVLEYIYFPTTRYKGFGYFPSLLDVLPIVFVLVSFKFIWDVQEKNKEVENLKSAVQESELQFLRTQINPHFLFNNLNNLYSYAIENSTKTPNIILELSSVLRYMLYDCKEKFVPLTKEIEHLKNFINLNNLQIEYRGDIQFVVNEIPSKFKIAPLILPVFVENAFKHSTASQSDKIKIDISIDISNEGELVFTCKNSFLPLENNQSLSKGIGLQNVQKRLKILYFNKYELIINENNNIYKVNLKLQL